MTESVAASGVADTVDLDHHLPALLFSLSARISQHAQRVNARPLGLDMCEWRAIQILGRVGASTINEVADSIAMDRGGTSRAITRMEHRGLVRRVPDGQDRRRSPVTLTEAGLDLHARVVRFALAREARLTRNLTPEERTGLADLLARVEAEAKAMLAQDWDPDARDSQQP